MCACFKEVSFHLMLAVCLYICHVCNGASVFEGGRHGPTAHNILRPRTPNNHARLSVERGQTRLQAPTHVNAVANEGHRSVKARLQLNRGRFCFEKKCKCKGSVADCSRNNGSLTFIPRLPRTVTSLNFTWNNLTAIVNDTFFINVTHITALDLSNNGLAYIVETAFQRLVNLTRLIVRVHSLNYTGLHPLLSVHTLEYLDISQGPLGPFPGDIFHRYPLPRLHTLCVNDSQIWSLNMSVFQPLVSLTRLHVGGNQISHQFYSESMASLKVFVLSRNGIFNFPKTCRKGESLFPELAELYLKNNILSTIPSDICLPELRILVLSSNMFSHLVTDMFSTRRFPSLSAVYLDAMSTQIVKIDKHAVSNPGLHVLSMMYNDIDLSVPDVHPDSFQGLPSLKKLQMGHNYVNYVTAERFITLFGNLTNLREICFGLDFIHNVTADMFKPYQRLTHLLFYDNEMTSLPDGVFDALPNLSHVYLGGNRLNTISEKTFGPDTRARLVKLDLSGNQFLCTCDLLWFRNWLVSDASKFTPSRYSYRCKNLPGLTVQEFFMARQACLLDRHVYGFIVVVVSILILSMTLTSSLFRFRWHLRLLLYETFRGHGDLRRRRLQTERFDYDVFVSYAGNDLPFVRQHLLPELEGRLGLRLCVHERDFTPGNNIVDNIVECVESSKKIMMIFSDSFVRSQWCQFELALCMRYVMDHDDALVIVCLNGVASRDMTGAMMAVLKTTTYIRWSTDPEAVASFWGRIVQALHEILPP